MMSKNVLLCFLVLVCSSMTVSAAASLRGGAPQKQQQQQQRKLEYVETTPFLRDQVTGWWGTKVGEAVGFWSDILGLDTDELEEGEPTGFAPQEDVAIASPTSAPTASATFDVTFETSFEDTTDAA